MLRLLPPKKHRKHTETQTHRHTETPKHRPTDTTDTQLLLQLLGPLLRAGEVGIRYPVGLRDVPAPSARRCLPHLTGPQAASPPHRSFRPLAITPHRRGGAALRAPDERGCRHQAPRVAVDRFAARHGNGYGLRYKAYTVYRIPVTRNPYPVYLYLIYSTFFNSITCIDSTSDCRYRQHRHHSHRRTTSTAVI